ncbi:protein of unknown function (DUF1858) [Desulfitobacterium dichloroeliminans LMG P-21439]|uniref:DUF1858 domain-containing protein n=1 Tax=Desulfitobacterium dichloroeliminans (strain LMG P-21439 / DCA1) TaxID=871963 RepID=L0F7U6_DESDL|nr:DUF1858 domain-containing protein [Desulfitobacterium dichloroeliminans]AGA69272.1 protein of unknown function (DUF1858) [Desulfitobacterium dichloroeliminans LMG P-21439]
MKTIDLSKSVYEICSMYPEVAEIMKEIGFKNIASPGMLNTAGRFMTIPKGAAMKKIDMGYIKETFAEKGFEINE